MVWHAVGSRLWHTTLVAALAALVVIGGSSRSAPAPLSVGPALPLAAAFQAAIWPVSDGLLVSEVVTGASSASDEFVEIYNASTAEQSLGGLELVYITASGSTVTRKQTWTELVVGPRRHLLLANSAGQWASLADGQYSGGFAASGGSLVLRTLKGTVVDSLSWGDAASVFVEGTAGPAASAGSSLERRPGGAAGNAADTNDNQADAVVQPNPVAQPLSADPVPGGGASPAPTPSATMTATPSMNPTASPTPSPPCTPEPTLEPTPSPEPEPTPTASPPPTAAPQLPIADVRAMPLGSAVVVSGRLSAAAGLLDDGRTSFVEDQSAGIAAHLPTDTWPALPAGTDVTLNGSLQSIHGQLTIVVPTAGYVVSTGSGPLPDPLFVATALACEPFEARLIAVEATVLVGLESTAEGLGAVVDDGSGPLHILIPEGVAIGAHELPTGALARLTGVLSQRDESGDGDSGYRLVLRSIADVVLLAPPPTPVSSPSATPLPSPSATPVPSPSASPLAIASARQQAVGSSVLVRGVVTVAPGWILGESVVAIQDATGGIYVKLPDDVPGGIAPGREIEVAGLLAAPYGNLEVRPAATGVRVLDMSSQPSPQLLRLADVDDNKEGILGRVEVTVAKIEPSSTGSLTLQVSDESAAGRIFFHAPLGAVAADFAVGERLSVIGLVGDRLGLYRLWPRNRSDVALISSPPTPTAKPAPTSKATPAPKPSTTPSPRPTGGDSSGPVISIAEALRRQGQTVTVEGTVTVRAGLLDSDALRVTIQDATAALLIRLPSESSAPSGRRMRVTGLMGTYYGAPQLGASQVSLGQAASVTALAVRGAPLSPGLEWRLVTVSGTIENVRRDGDAWRAELTLPGGGVPIVGLERSAIPSTALEAGRVATITGIVKRAFPTASDQRLAVVPRSTTDIRLGPAAASSPGLAATLAASGPPSAPHATGSIRPEAPAGGVALADVAAHVGATVLVGGTVVALDGPTVTIEDATASAVVRLVGDAAPLARLMTIGDLVNAAGRVERSVAAGLHVVVDDPSRVSILPAMPADLATSPVPSGAPDDEPPAWSVGSEAPVRSMPMALVALAVALAGTAALAVAVLVHPAGRRRSRVLFERLRARVRG